MSRIGKKPIAIPAGVTATVESGTLTVKGPKGTLAMQLLDDLVKYEIGEGEIRVTPLTQAQRNRAAWGMQRTNVQNLVTGVTEGFSKVLEITGVGYRAQAQGKNLKLQLGYSHDVNYAVPEGVEVKTPDNTTVEISGSGPVQVVLRPVNFADSVVVTATRGAERLPSAASSTVLTSAELSNMAAGALDDALRSTPGFTLFRRSSSRGVMVNGSGPIADAPTMYAAWAVTLMTSPPTPLEFSP